MKLSGGTSFPTISLPNGTWYRAVTIRHRRTPLGVGRGASRYKSLAATYSLVYLAQSPDLALLEVQALVRSNHISSPLSVAVGSYFVAPIQVKNIKVVDFGDPVNRGTIEASIQEMTGDWRSYAATLTHGNPPYVRANVRQASAPTQDLGQVVSNQGIHGVLAPSVYEPVLSNLIVCVDNFYTDPTANTIDPERDNH